MAENISFRTAVGGFNRNDVIEFVRRLLEENRSLQEQIQTLRQSVSEGEARSLEQKTRIGELERECESLRNSKNEVTKLGAAMVDARRFSDQLIQEANDRVNEIYESASSTALNAEAKLNELTEHMGAISGEVSLSLSDVRARLNELSLSLNDFGGTVNGSRTDFNRQFTPAEDSALFETAAGNGDVLFSAADPGDDPDATTDVIRKKSPENIRKRAVIKGKPAGQRVRRATK